MFRDTKAFSSFAVNDLQKAKEFYSETLGLGEKGTFFFFCYCSRWPSRGPYLDALSRAGQALPLPRPGRVPSLFSGGYTTCLLA